MKFKKGINFPLYVLFIFLFLSVDSLNSQSYIAHIKNFSIEEGISHNSVQHIFEDHRGFIWISTRYGLNRFDGKEFKWYTHEKQGLHNNMIHFATEDQNHMIWVMTGAKDQKGQPFEKFQLSIFNPFSEKVIPLHQYFSKDILNDLGQIVQYSNLPNQGILLLTNSGKLISYYNSNKIEVLQLDKTFKHTTELRLLENGNIWVFEDFGAKGYLFAPDGKEINSFKFPFLWTHIKHQENNTLYVTARSAVSHDIQIFSISPDGNYRLNDWSTVDPKLKGREIILEAVDTERNIHWINTGDTLYAVHPKHKIIFQTGDIHLASFSAIDQNHIFWGSNMTDGLFRIDIQPNLFKNISTPVQCRGLWKDDHNNLWNYFAQVPIHPKKNGSPKLISNHSPMGFAITEDHEGLVWTSDKGQFIVYKRDSLQSPFKIKQIFSKRIWTISQINQDQMLFGGSSGLYFVDRESLETIKLDSYNGFSDLRKSTIYDIQVINNKIWICSSNGLFTMTKEKGIINQYGKSVNGKNYLPAKDFHHLYYDEEGIFWLATGDGGLIRWNGNDEYQQYTIADGLSSNVLHAIYEDDYDFLWISSENGIIQFNKSTHFSRNWLRKHGLSQSEFNRISHLKDEQGNIYFGGLSGITWFHPKDFQQPSKVPNNHQIRITEVLPGK